MKILFKSRKLEKSLTDPTVMAKTYGTRAKRVNQRMLEIKASSSLAVLMSIPAANCHQLSTGQFALDVSKNYRMIIEPASHPIPLKGEGGIDCVEVTVIAIIEIKDYH